MESAWNALLAARGLKMAMLAAGGILILVSDEYLWRRVLGGGLLVSAQFVP